MTDKSAYYPNSDNVWIGIFYFIRVVLKREYLKKYKKVKHKLWFYDIIDQKQFNKNILYFLNIFICLGGNALKKNVKNKKYRKAYRSQRQAANKTSMPVKRKAGKINTKYKALTVAVFAMLLFYLLGYIIVFMGKPSVPTETVNYGTIDNPQTLEGLIVRDEYTVNSTMDGEISFSFAENSKVPKGAVVCSIKDTGITDDIESQIKKIDKDILNAQKSRIDLSKNKEEIVRIENEISAFIDNSVYKLTADNLTGMYSLKSNIDGFIETKIANIGLQVVWKRNTFFTIFNKN